MNIYFESVLFFYVKFNENNHFLSRNFCKIVNLFSSNFEKMNMHMYFQENFREIEFYKKFTMHAYSQY